MKFFAAYAKYLGAKTIKPINLDHVSSVKEVIIR